MGRKIYFLPFVGLLLLSFSLRAQIPDGYYDDAIGLTGDELKAALHNIIKDHKEYSYNALRDYILKATDEDPDNSNNVILIYSGISRPKADFGGNLGDWNREHVWAKSHGDFGTDPPAGTDAHHIRPADVQINSLRSNLDFDLGGSPVSNCEGCKKDGDSFEPPDRVKGDVARMIFYMAVRYEGDGGEPDLEVVDAVNTSPAPEHGKLSALLEWNEQDPPDDFERNRNDVIYYQYQENRNPFIDHPEFVGDIWGDPQAISETASRQLACYPNPTDNSLFVEYAFNGGIGFVFRAFDGRKVMQGELHPGKTAIDLSRISRGLYLLELTDENGQPAGQYKIIKN